MTNSPTTCDEFDAILSDLLEGTLNPASRVAAETHAASCARCGALRRDLKELESDASRLPVLRPTRDLWDGIAARIEAPAIELRGRAALRAWQRPSRLAAAAVLLVAATATTTWTIARSAAGSATPDTTVDATAVEADESTPVARLVAAYDPEIAELRTLIEERRSTLDSATMLVLEQNLRIIDDAIARSRAALNEAPASQFLARQLAKAYDHKLHTLRRIVSMPAEISTE